MRPVILPAGLEDENVEIYLHKGELRAIYKGRVMPFKYLPAEFIDNLSAAMMADVRAMKSLIQDMLIVDPVAMLEQYVKCNFGNFDAEPDVTRDGLIIKECWDCGVRGECPGEGKVCKRLQGKEGMLTGAETSIFFLVIEGKLDKEISGIMEITIPTVETHLKHIREKLAVNNRIEIMGWAMKRKLLFIP
jgi:DNA-binding CsgD family transcriptional regulator